MKMSTGCTTASEEDCNSTIHMLLILTKGDSDYLKLILSQVSQKDTEIGEKAVN